MTKNSGWGSQYFAPYVDMTLAATSELSDLWNERGMKQKFANLAFVNANTKTGETAWGGIADFAIGKVGEKKNKRKYINVPSRWGESRNLFWWPNCRKC